MEKCPLWVVLTLGALATGAGTLTGLVEHKPRIALVVVMVVALLAALLLSLAREDRREKLTQLAEDQHQATRADSQEMLDRQITPLLWNALDLICETSLPNKRTLAMQVQTAVVTAAAMIVGSGAVRANLFEKTTDSQGECMKVKLFHGRGTRSRRVFRPADPTMAAAEVGDYRFVSQVNDASLVYDTYLTVPITTQTKLYGVLTLDALNEGELSEDDVKLVTVLALIAALAFAALD